MTITVWYNSMKFNSNYYRIEGDLFDATIYNYFLQ